MEEQKIAYTVADLIALLQEFPQDAHVVVYDGGTCGDYGPPVAELFDGRLTGYDWCPWNRSYGKESGGVPGVILR